MSLFRMVSHRVKKVIAWIITLGVLALLAAGAYYVVEVL